MATKTKQTRWVCPSCGNGCLGPTRPRKDNIVRYCLPCSEKTGKLVERETPALTKKRERQAEKSAMKRKARAERAKKAEKKRTHLTLWDEGGRIVEVDVRKTVYDIAKKAGMHTSFDLTWNRRTDGSNTGRANEHRVHLSIGSRSLEYFCMIVAHELGHAKAGGRAGHSERWKDAYEEICAKNWDTKPVFRLEVQSYRYAIDPKIQAQLEATSRGEYKRSKAKLPLAGKQIGAWAYRDKKCTANRGFVDGQYIGVCKDGHVADEPCHRCKGKGGDCLWCSNGTVPGYECKFCNGTGLRRERYQVRDDNEV